VKTRANISRIGVCFIALISILLTQVDAGAASPQSSVGYAVWYRVPPKSLARMRAGNGEFTAAHNRLPLGTLVRVTRLSNGCTVVVRITDRGITNRRAKIDICREAAEELGMIHVGLARVRMEIVPESRASAGENEVSAH
jgi:rare lipoprotein A